MFSCEFCEISKNTFSYRTPLVAASVNCSENAHSLKKITRRRFLTNFYYLQVFKKYFRALNNRNEQCLSKEENGLIILELLKILSWSQTHKLKYNKSLNFWKTFRTWTLCSKMWIFGIDDVTFLATQKKTKKNVHITNWISELISETSAQFQIKI